MSKHTPGPWFIFNTADIFTELGAENAEGVNAPSKDGWMIADCDMGGLSLAEVRANARLIAAAPDLLEALIDCEKRLTNMVGMSDLCANEIQRSINLARAAIAKARGES